MYKVNDIVYAADIGKLHEAKILKVQRLENDESKYFIHYQGWARKYDTWMDEMLLAPVNDKKLITKLQDKAEEMWNPSSKREEKDKSKVAKVHIGGNKVIQVEAEESPEEEKDAAEQRETKAKAKARRGSKAEESAPVAHRGKRRSRVFSPEDEANGEFSVLAKEETGEQSKRRRRALLMSDLMDEDDSLFAGRLPLPFPLKKFLVDDWSLIARDGKRLVPLPKTSPKNVRSILADFLDMKKNDKNTTSEMLLEYRQFFVVFLVYFDRALATLLLYRQERAQFDKLRSLYPNVFLYPSIAYGAEHLLRFYVRLPKLLYGVVVPQQDFNNFIDKLNGLLKFVSKRMEQFLDITEYKLAEEAMAAMDSEGTAVLEEPCCEL